MTTPVEIQFLPLSAAPAQTAVALTGEELALAPAVRALDDKMKGGLGKAARAAGFSGKARTSIEILAPGGLDVQRLIVAGAGRAPTEQDRLRLGGYAFAQISARKADTASLIADLTDTGDAGADTLAADLALGALLRSYSFDKYKSRKSTAAGSGNGNGNGKTEDADSEARNGLKKLRIHCADPAAAEQAFISRKALADGIFLARDLINEPANILGPAEFSDRLLGLTAAGLSVEVLEEPQLRELGMGALLAVGQGSVRPTRVVVLQWQGAQGGGKAQGGKSKKAAKPLCFVGKGVCFDSGGISLKPGAGMEEMKGDMGGAAAVAGLMLALAGRKAPVHAVGLIGLVENMPSASAQRPGDIITSMSGQTIEVHNTDAEGRLLLADVLWYAQERFKPRLIIDLATLTGAIIMALGKEFAGLFSNDSKLAAELTAAGEATGERVWRMPLDKAYDKMIDTKNADMKNVGGRHGGAITAAQFLQRFIKDKDTPWAHLDVAGTAMDSPRTEINQSWGGGWGVRLLDRLVADCYEKGEK